MQKVPLQIDSLAKEGWGVASWERPDGLVREVAVPTTLVGEQVVADIFHCKKTGLIGRIASIPSPSSERIQARCSHFSYCGGCAWQMMPYEKQLAIKEARIKELFKELLLDSTVLHGIIPAPAAWQYRNKMEFSFSEDTKGQKFLGLIERCSRGRVFNLQECHLMQPWVAETVQACRNWWHESTLKAYYMPKNSGSLRNLTLRESGFGDRVIVLTVSGNPEYAIKRADLDRFVSCCQEVALPQPANSLSIVLRIQQVHKGRPTEFFEMILFGPDTFREQVQIGDTCLEFRLSPSSFFQPNSQTASHLYARALELANLTKETVLYDLYAGIGVFGMCASHLVKEVVAIELSADSAYDARCNSQRLNRHNFRIIQGDVAAILRDESLPQADVAIVDPPRSGLGKASIAQIVKLAPKRLVYVSCNPTTQALDVRDLVQAGFQLTCMQPIDQFPQTVHVENIAILQR